MPLLYSLYCACFPQTSSPSFRRLAVIVCVLRLCAVLILFVCFRLRFPSGTTISSPSWRCLCAAFVHYFFVDLFSVSSQVDRPTIVVLLMPLVCHARALCFIFGFPQEIATPLPSSCRRRLRLFSAHSSQILQFYVFSNFPSPPRRVDHRPLVVLPMSVVCYFRALRFCLLFSRRGCRAFVVQLLTSFVRRSRFLSRIPFCISDASLLKRLCVSDSCNLLCMTPNEYPLWFSSYMNMLVRL